VTRITMLFRPDMARLVLDGKKTLDLRYHPKGRPGDTFAVATVTEADRRTVVIGTVNAEFRITGVTPYRLDILTSRDDLMAAAGFDTSEAGVFAFLTTWAELHPDHVVNDHDWVFGHWIERVTP
jgi:hypothetical protein